MKTVYLESRLIPEKCVEFILRTKWHVLFNVQENKRFKVVNLFGFCVCEDGKQVLYH